MQNETPDPTSRPTRPIYAVPVERKKTGLLVTGAVLAGLAVGGFAFYAAYTKHAAASRDAAEIPAVSPESTPSAVTPPPEADVAGAGERHRTARKRVKASSAASERAATRRSDEVTPPVLLTPPAGAQTSAKQAQQTAAQNSAPSRPAPASSSSGSRRRAVQDPGSDYAPMPLPASGDASNQAPNAAAPQSETAPSDRPVLHRHAGASDTAPTAQSPATAAAAASGKAAGYTGPGAGMATWTGKLEKNEMLIITGGTPSKGVLAGAGLPGVPVRVTVDQVNLGFVEMPDAANGYRKLVLRSHAKHEKLTIHWTVIE